MMLTKKQIWRRTKSCKHEIHIITDESAKETSAFSSIIFFLNFKSNLNKSVSKDTIDTISSESYDEELFEIEQKSSKYNRKAKISNKVSFNDKVEVILIATRKEYEAASLNDVLWWKHKDYQTFRRRASQQIEFVMNVLNIISAHEAMKQLYQPGYNIQESLLEMM